MKSKIALAFDNCKREKRPALITYTVAGDSTKEISFKILNKSNHLNCLYIVTRIITDIIINNNLLYLEIIFFTIP